MKKIYSCLLLVLFFSLTLVSQNEVKQVQAALQKQLVQGKLTAQDVTDWTITSSHRSSISDVLHIYYRQQVEGIEIYGTDASIHIASSGKTIASHTNFIQNALSELPSEKSASISPAEALQSAMSQLGYGGASARITTPASGVKQAGIMEDNILSRSAIPFKLMYHYSEKDGLRLVWDMSIEMRQVVNWWNVRIDAITGEVLDKIDWTVQCTSEENHVHDLSAGPRISDELLENDHIDDNEELLIGNYEVFAMPDESPQNGSGSRVIVSNPDDGSVAGSPFGWHDTNGIPGAEFTITRGNNAHAYDDGNNAGFSPNGGGSLDFTGYSFNPFYTNGNQSESAAITNLFYWTNIIHDIIYVYGMDEAAGNFQQNNYGNGGAGNDYVRSEAQDGSGTCNANFSTPTDGSLPRMQMYVCNNRDGDFDNGVIVHEYGHGISIRLTGGGGNSGCLFGSERMGEGWSDWYALMLTLEPGDTGEDKRGIGMWLVGQGPNGNGIRPQPYSTDNTTADGDPAINTYTYNTIGSGVSIPHGVGSVWSQILWEVTWALIDEHGFDPDIYNFTGDVSQDAGNVQAMALVTEGLKLQPCGPGFVTGRDAIIAADAAIYGGANQCVLWEAFAKRGLGFSADQGSVNSNTDGTEAFDLPTTILQIDDTICVNQSNEILGGGIPQGGVYSGPGVTDNGDGATFTFDPSGLGTGIYTISYVAPVECSASDTATDTIEVIDAIPQITCQDISVDLDVDGVATISQEDLVTNLIPGGYISDQSGTFTPINITPGGTTVSLADDQVSNALPIGFSFDFYGIEYSNFYISSNGFITFTSGSDNACCNGLNIPTAGGESDNFIAFAWDDINPSVGGTIRYQTVGTAPNRKLVMEFDGVPFYGTSNLVTSQIHLFEGSNRIEIHSEAIPSNGNVSQGIENINGTSGVATPGRNAQVWSTTNDYVAFYRTPATSPINCGATTSISLSQDTFGCSDIGDTSVTITITDENGVSNTCTSTVTVNAGDAPLAATAVCQDMTVELDTNGNASITAEEIDNGSTIDCGSPANITNISINQSEFTCANIGENQVTLTVFDGAGNSDSCVAAVTVVDTIAPTVVCQNITLELDGNGIGSITPDQVDNGSNDLCGIGSMSLSQTSFTCENLGQQTVTLTVTDTNGNTASCNTIITVTDTTAPEAICQSITVVLDENGQALVSPDQIDNGSTDACGIGSMSLSQTSFTCEDIGTQSVQFTVTDTNGNTNTCTTTVTVIDEINPTVVCQNITVLLDENGETTISPDQIDNGSTDSCGIQSMSLSQTLFTCEDIGTQSIEFTTTDINGNTNTCTAMVTIVDNVNPIALCLNITVELDENGQALITSDQIDNGSTDACGIVATTLSQTSFTCDDIGEQSVVMSVTDSNENITGCVAVVTVVDAIAPNIVSCLEDTTELIESGDTFIIPDYTVEVVATDNCSTAVTLIQSPEAGTVVEAGTTIPIVFFASDDSGNEVSCEFNLTVDQTLSNEDFNTLETALRIYPIPTADQLTIDYTGTESIERIMVFDFTGKKVKEIINASAIQDISMQQLANGVYFVQINTATASIVKRIIKR